MNERQAKQLHYDVMGIALAIRGHTGETGLFQHIDAALTGLDWDGMIKIQTAFNMLRSEQQELILGDMGDPDEIGHSIAIFERSLHQMGIGTSQRTA